MTETERDRKNLVLCAAINKQDVEKVKELIATGVDVNYVRGSGWTALYEAVAPLCKDPSVEIVKLLIDAGADVNYSNEHFSVVERAAFYNNMEIVNLLREHGAKLNFSAIFLIYFINLVRNYFSKPLTNFVRKYVDIDEYTLEGYCYIIVCVSLGNVFGIIGGYLLTGVYSISTFFLSWSLSMVVVTVVFALIRWLQERGRQ